MLGERISELRRRRKMTQRQLADYLSVSLNSVSLYERNLSTPDDDTKIKIAELFDVSMDYLMGTSSQETPLHKTQPRPSLLLYENLPPDAYKELQSFVKYLREKYKFSRNHGLPSNKKQALTQHESLFFIVYRSLAGLLLFCQRRKIIEDLQDLLRILDMAVGDPALMHSHEIRRQNQRHLIIHQQGLFFLRGPAMPAAVLQHFP